MILTGAGAALVAGLTLEVWAAVAVGVLSIAAVGALNHAIDTGDFSGQSLLRGAEGAFWPTAP